MAFINLSVPLQPDTMHNSEAPGITATKGRGTDTTGD